LQRPERVHFLGAVERKRLGSHYRDADVTCVPSVSETLPTVALESLVAGTPVVGSDVGGIPFIVESGINGLIVPKADFQGLADAIQEIHRDPSLLGRLQGNARGSVLPRFSWEAVGLKLHRAIRETLAARSMAEPGRSRE
jgi:glycosyltransferase involved in cell wall biosynthesis